MYQDQRGTINDLLVGEKGAVTHITFTKGAVRANHYHKETVQYDFILKGKLICKSGAHTTEVSEGEMITHPKNTPHAYKALEDSEMVSLTFGPRKGEDYENDTYRLSVPLI